MNTFVTLVGTSGTSNQVNIGKLDPATGQLAAPDNGVTLETFLNDHTVSGWQSTYRYYVSDVAGDIGDEADRDERIYAGDVVTITKRISNG